jgi:flagellin-specific chaperone FliS
MNPYAAYAKPQSVDMTRIDMLLSLYDGAIEQLEQAVGALRKQEPNAAQPFLVRAQLIIGGLASGLNLGDGELPINMLRLFEFAADSIRIGNAERIEGSLNVLRTLREGFEEIRPQAIALERAGTIPPVDAVKLVSATA